jgi:streptogramin lyase
MRPTRRLLYLAALALALAAGAPAASAAKPIGLAEGFHAPCAVQGVVPVPGGGAWFSCATHRVGGVRSRAAVGRVTEAGKVRLLPGAFPPESETGIGAAGADGSFWFAVEPPLESGKGPAPESIAHVTPAGAVKLFPLGLKKPFTVDELVVAPSGYVWLVTGRRFADTDMALWQISPTGGLTKTPVALTPKRLPGLAVGTEGDLWFTNGAAGVDAPLLHLAPDGMPTPVPGQPSGFGARRPTAGADGSVWYFGGTTEKGVGRVPPGGSITDTGGQLTPPESSTIHSPVVGGDGSLWFGIQVDGPSKIGRVTQSGHYEELGECLTYGQPFFGPETLVAGAEGNVWFTSLDERSLPAISDPPSIGLVTPEGSITQLYAGVDASPNAIAPDAQGGVWFAGGTKEIERIKPPDGPINTVYIGDAQEVRRSGAAALNLKVPSGGRISAEPVAIIGPHRSRTAIHGPTVSGPAEACGYGGLDLRLTGEALRRFKADGEVTVAVAVTFTPAGGTPYTEEKHVYFRRPRH